MIQYVTQVRWVKPDGTVGEDWGDRCRGHKEDNFSEAQECHARAEAFYDLKLDPEDLTELFALQIIRHSKKEGVKFEVRMIKRTTSEEAVDA